MRLLASLLAFTLLFGALAGCLGDDADPAPAPAAADEAATGDADAPEAQNDDGTDEGEAASLGHQPHLHDYWQGRERVTLMDEDVTVDAFTATFHTFLNAVDGRPAVGGAAIALPDGQIVYEGTGRLEVTLSWTDPLITGMTLRHRTPAEAAWSEPQAVTQATALGIDLTPEMTDMPHAKTSRWAFLVQPGAGQTLVGTFHVKVDILKMRDIGLFPGHPEHFQGARTLEVFNGHGTSSQDNFALQIANFLAGTRQDDGVQAQRIVPMETRSMTANLSIVAATAQVGDVSDIYLLVKTADRNGYRFVEPVAVDETTGIHRFAWLVEMTNTDSPYASESDWRFDVWAQSDPSGGALDTSCGGCSGAQVEYDLVVVAHDDVVEGAKELRGGRGRG